ncbi:hypothetical protein ACLH0K_13610 [Arthrobacter sp. MPF02]|uniref:hypothetical protein n=1 Tax=Arthrobacter sp. MPF02 TaxID=3388492 RepID=UPI0039851EE5
MAGVALSIPVACNQLFPQVLNPPKPAATRDVVQPIVPGPSTAPAAQAAGWPSVPLALGNDFVAVTVQARPDEFCQGNTGWVTPELPSALPVETQLKNGTRAWAAENGAVLNSGNFIEVTVQVQNNHRLTIDSIGVTAVDPSPPLEGYLPQLSGGCGAEVPATFQVNLDSNVTTSISGVDQAGREIEPIPLPHTLNEQDREGVWKIKVVTETCDCEFVPYFTYTTEDGRSRTFEIRLAGDKPWRVTSSSEAQRVARTDESGTWSAQ